MESQLKIKTPKIKQLPNLPEELIEEAILLRLPVKSLLRFRCVSQRLRFLIGTQMFIKTHLKNSTNNENLTHHRIISTIHGPHSSFKRCSLRSLFFSPVTSGFPFDYPTNLLGVSFRVVGCCNGLICIIVNQRRFFLWNPSTRESRMLPHVNDGTEPGLVIRHGFGYDEFNDDYKVLAFRLISRCRSRKPVVIAEIFSLRTNSWTQIEDSGRFRSIPRVKFVSGKLHWGRDLVPNNSGWEIVSFDLQTEECGIVEQPHYVAEEAGVELGLQVLGGCLSLICHYRDIRLDVWVLKEYGVRESWDKVATVPYLFNALNSPSISRPLWIGSNGEILLLCSSTFVIYNTLENSTRLPLIINIGEFDEANVYVESLVSLD